MVCRNLQVLSSQLGLRIRSDISAFSLFSPVCLVYLDALSFYRYIGFFVSYFQEDKKFLEGLLCDSKQCPGKSTPYLCFSRLVTEKVLKICSPLLSVVIFGEAVFPHDL